MAIDRDYCSGWFEGTWSHCCKVHDEAYEVLLQIHDLALLIIMKSQADIALGQCVEDTDNEIMGGLMALGTLTLGWGALLLNKARKRFKSK